MTNVVTVLGSPRQDASSARLADAVAESLAGGAGASSRHVINSLKHVRGCQACQACKGKSETCVVKDDLAPVLAAAASADFLIIAAPNYIGEITAQLKLFIDRTYSWFKPDFHSAAEPGRLSGKGKKALLIFTQGNPDPGAYARAYEAYKAYFQGQGFKTAYKAVPVPVGPGADKAVADAAAELKALAASL
ncbi:MAG: flavodoxin family protein [Deltaproteobacteria bacterium]|jgi:multimeric flavodoxin WrbA|nr:flavodoxin family protein [Deltaproteobacteria bacterium]